MAKRTTQQTLGDRVAYCAKRLSHSANLASIAATGQEPERGALYLLDTVKDLAKDLEALRRSKKVRATA